MAIAFLLAPRAQSGARIRLVDGAQQILEFSIVGNGEAALEPTPQPLKVAIGQQADRDDMLLRQCPNSGELVLH